MPFYNRKKSTWIVRGWFCFQKPELTRVLVMMRAQQSGGHHVRHAESWSRQPAGGAL